jgi:hypothetical protein
MHYIIFAAVITALVGNMILLFERYKWDIGKKILPDGS